MEKIMWLLLLVLSGCATVPPSTVPVEKIVKVEVKVPVYSCPTPPVLDRPELLTDTISDKDDFVTVAKKYKGTIIQLQDYSEGLEKIISMYGVIAKNKVEKAR